jgi:hypothetical protein
MTENHISKNFFSGTQPVTDYDIPNPVDSFVRNWNGSGDTTVVQLDKLTNIPNPSDFDAVREIIQSAKPGTYEINTQAYLNQGRHGEYWSQAYSVGNVRFDLNGTLTISAENHYDFSGKLSSPGDPNDWNEASHRTPGGEFLTTVGRAILGSKTVMLSAPGGMVWGGIEPYEQFRPKDYMVEFIGHYQVRQSGAVDQLPGQSKDVTQGHCFAAATKIGTPDGLIPITMISAGTRILAFDVDQKIVSALVSNIFRGITTEWLILSIGLTVTPGHRFLNEFLNF